ncbi:MAG: alpha/beta hydrolase [Chitinophagales bacterium]|nr:alpha/beta hydrolase [Chitinophagales bacterium]
MRKSIYKNEKTKDLLMSLYDEKLESLKIDYKNIDIESSYGKTRVVQAGKATGKPIVIFHGFNAGSPITLEAVIGLMNDYNLYVIETVGQATKSEGDIMNIKDDSFAIWADEVIEQLNLSSINIVGISYGAFIVGKILTHKPERIDKCILVVPSGIVNGNFWESMKKLTIPLMKWRFTQKEEDLNTFLSAFIPPNDPFMHKMLTIMMKGIHLDTRIPKLLKTKDVQHFDRPVYIIAADKDVYFPGEKIIERSKSLFKNLQGTHLLKNSNHMPSKASFEAIQMKLREWID